MPVITQSSEHSPQAESAFNPPSRPKPSFTLQTTAATAEQTVARFYAQREWQPLWDNKRLAALLVEIRELKADGLNPHEYALAALETCLHQATQCTSSPERELMATRAYLKALEHLFRGKVDPSKLDPDWNFDRPAIDTEQGLAMAREAVENNRIAGIFQRARPALPRYTRMRTTLMQLYQQAQQGGWPTVPAAADGKSLKPGTHDERVIPLRRRLQISSPQTEPVTKDRVNMSGKNADYFDTALEQAVKRYQQSTYLVADGAAGKHTLQQLNIPIEERIGQLRVNLERMRWHLHKMTGNYIIVDVAGYTIAYMRDDKILWQSRVQVGKRYRKTPIFQSSITHITLNPQWTIPPTILHKDTLPAIRKDNDYLEKHRIRIFNSKNEELPPDTINWNNPGNIILRQDAGTHGALGQIAIRFPNTYAVYLHETPQQSLFNADQRSFSSGCIRVQNIRDLAVLLMDNPGTWNREKLENALAGGKTREVILDKKIPVLIDYWTVDIAEDGYVSWRPDVYGKDKDILDALNKP